MRVMRLAIGSLLAVASGIGLASLSSAQAPDIRIAELKCNGDPELVAIENAGDAAQQLAGWKLQSDPASEVFDLSVLGGLQSGVSIFIQAGPAATGVFKWGTQFVFRDDDPTDYVRIVDNNGATVDQVNCGGPTPAAPSPTANPANGVRGGGGSPRFPEAAAAPGRRRCRRRTGPGRDRPGSRSGQRRPAPGARPQAIRSERAGGEGGRRLRRAGPAAGPGVPPVPRARLGARTPAGSGLRLQRTRSADPLIPWS